MARFTLLLALAFATLCNVAFAANDANDTTTPTTNNKTATVKSSSASLRNVLHIGVGRIVNPETVKANQAAKEYLSTLNGLMTEVYNQPVEKFTAYTQVDALELMASYEAEMLAARANSTLPETYDALAFVEMGSLPDIDVFSDELLGAR